MALVTTRTDDLNGEPDAVTVVIVVNGKGIEVDLADKSMERLTKALAPFWKIGSERDYDVTPRARRRPPTPSVNGAVPADIDPAAVRAWAAEHGVEISPRGRIPAAVVEHYRESTRAHA